MVCSKCGMQNPDGVSFCTNCGQSLFPGNANQNFNNQQQYGGQQYGGPQYGGGQQYGGPQYAPPQNTEPEYVTNTKARRPVSVGFGEAIKIYFKNYANFDGRASKGEYWFSVLFSFLVGLVCWIPFLGAIIALGLLVPSLAVQVRRLHDIGKDWYYIFMSLIPFAGFIIMIVYMCQDSVGDNQWGQGPVGVPPAFVNGVPNQPYNGQPYNGGQQYNGQQFNGQQYGGNQQNYPR